MGKGFRAKHSELPWENTPLPNIEDPANLIQSLGQRVKPVGFGPVGRPDVVVASSPQFLVALSGWSLSALKRVPLVLEVRDLWPDSIVAVGALSEGSLAVRLLRVLERFAYRRSDLTVSVTRLRENTSPALMRNSGNSCSGGTTISPDSLISDTRYCLPSLTLMVT